MTAEADARAADAESADAAPLVDSAPTVDAPPVTACDPQKPFGQPSPILSLNSAQNDMGAWLSEDLLTVYFESDRTGTLGSSDLWWATRATASDDFDTPQPVDNLNTDRPEGIPQLTADQRTIFFSQRSVADPDDDIYVATRSSTAVAFGDPELLLNVNDPDLHDHPTWINADATVMYIGAVRAAEWNIYRTTRTSPTATFDLPQIVSALDADGFEDWGAVLTADQRTVLFESLRTPTLGAQDIYEATRSTVNDGFGEPTKVTQLSTDAAEWPTWVSADGCHIVFTSNRADGGGGAYDLWMATRPL